VRWAAILWAPAILRVRGQTDRSYIGLWSEISRSSGLLPIPRATARPPVGGGAYQPGGIEHPPFRQPGLTVRDQRLQRGRIQPIEGMALEIENGLQGD
jgi:hypothetical protein